MTSRILRRCVFLLPAIVLVAALGCETSSRPLGESERAAIGDSILGLATRADAAVDRLDCEEGLKAFGDREPLFVGEGRVTRTRAELAQMCARMVSARTGAHYELASSDVHVLSRDVAYLVREGSYTIEFAEAEARTINLVITGIWERGEAGWARVHFHESWPTLAGG